MIKIVVDASIVLSWLLNEESHSGALPIFHNLASDVTVLAPQIQQYEVANVLVIACTRRKRLSPGDMISALKDFIGLPIQIDADSGSLAVSAVAEIALECDLSVYDAAYVELALRKGCPLLTGDAKLKTAAVHAGAQVI